MTPAARLLAIGVFLIWGGSATAAVISVGGAGTKSSGAVGEEAARARALVASLEKPGDPGCALGVMRDGAWVFKGAYGLADIAAKQPNTPQLVFGVASITKQFTAAAAAIAAHQGYFSLDDDVRKYLPELKQYAAPITVRDLVQHTNGLRDHGRLVDLTGKPHRYRSLEERLALLMRQSGSNFPAGTEFRYGNTGYLFLAAIIERTTLRSLPQFAEENIFRPLGMRDTYFGVDTRGRAQRAIPYSRDGAGWRNTDIEIADPADFGSGGVMTTLDDYAKWARTLFASQSALPGGTQLTKQLRSPGHLRDGTTTTYAFGLRLDPYRGIETVAHSGSGAGYKALAMIFPQQSLAVMGFCNNGIYAQPVVMALADIYLHLPPANAKVDGSAAGDDGAMPATTSLSPREWTAFEGTYREPVLRLPLRVKAGASDLIVEGDALTYHFKPISRARFRNEENVVIEFDAATSGPAPRLRQVQGRKYGSGVFERIDVATPSPAQLAQYRGDYFSADLNATYRFTVENDMLVARMLDAEEGVEPFRLEPLLADEFVSMPEQLALVFTRSGDGAISGLKLTCQFGWVTDVEFQRAGDPVAAWSAQQAMDPSKDLGFLKSFVGDARVLAFGEGTHNAHELWQWRNRLFRYAVEHLGFTAIAAETGYAQSLAADDYVQGRDIPLEKAVRGVFSWVDAPFEENRELLDWMREWNSRATTSRKLRFYGLEMAGNLHPRGALLVEPALAYLGSVDVQRAKAVAERLRPLLGGFDIDRYPKLSAARRDDLAVAVQDVVTLFERFRVVWIARSSPESFERAYHHAVAARQMVAHLRLDGDGRDIAAAENIRWALEREGPHGRVFLFAHNSHVAKWRKLPADESRLHSTMMELARDVLGDDVRVIASFYDGGTTKDWLGMFGITREVRTLEPSIPQSVNAMLAKVGPSTLFLDLASVPASGPIREWFDAERPVRNINVREGYNDIRPARAFDALLFVRDISPLEPMGMR